MATGRTVGVIGLGTVGSALATAASRAGMDVVAVVRDRAGIRPLSGVHVGTDPGVLAEADIVVEAVPERLADKVAVLRAADRICRPDTVFATSATVLSVAEVATSSGRPQLVAGFHPVPPAARASAELVAGPLTAPTAL